MYPTRVGHVKINVELIEVMYKKRWMTSAIWLECPGFEPMLIMPMCVCGSMSVASVYT